MDIEEERLRREGDKLKGMIAESLRRAEASAGEVRARGRQISGWVILANGAALLFCFSALLNGKVCDWSAFSPLMYLFAGGLAASYIAFGLEITVEHLFWRVRSDMASNSEFLLWHNQTVLKFGEQAKEARENDDKVVLEKLETALAGLKDDAEEGTDKLAKTENQLKTMDRWTVLTATFSALGVFLFAYGLIGAIREPQYRLSLCEYAAPATNPDQATAPGSVRPQQPPDTSAPSGQPPEPRS